LEKVKSDVTVLFPEPCPQYFGVLLVGLPCSTASYTSDPYFFCKFDDMAYVQTRR